ncbi:MAG: multidrug efflux pump subunit AcrB, partial [Bradymonadia bacterium]
MLEETQPGPTSETPIGGPLAFMARNSVAANLLMLALVVGGLLMMGKVRQEVFPESAPDVVSVSVVYPGASPAEVEQGIVLAIEEALSGVDGIKELTASAAEGVGTVSIEIMLGADKDAVLSDVQAAVDRVTSFPLDAERPTVAVASRRSETISIIFFGDAGERQLRGIAQIARDQLLQDPRITDVSVTEVRPLEISIEASEANLRQYGLTLPEIASIVGNASVELPAGTVDTPAGEVLLRTDERRDLGEEFADITLIGRPDGTRVRVGDVATVIDGFQDTDSGATFNGEPAARVRVFRAGDQTPIELSDAVYEYLANSEGLLPPGVSAEVWFDRSESYRDRINLLLKNAYLGLILVLLVLGLFLDVRLAFWVTLGIPISFLGAIILMPSADVSFNMISLFAFMLTLGIVVDDAIVVGEAVHHQRTLGHRGVEASIRGVKEVATPVIFSVLTTMIAFVPMLVVPGSMGRFIRVIPLIVISVFLISLVESLLILPAHLAHASDKPAGGLLGGVQRAQKQFSRGFDALIVRIYGPSLRPIVEARYLTVTVSLALIVFSVGLVKAGHVKVTFLPKVESDVVTANLRMPFGTPAEQTEAILSRIVEISEGLLDENGGQDEICRGIYATVGSGADSFGPGGGGGSGSHAGSVSVNMVPMDERE